MTPAPQPEAQPAAVVRELILTGPPLSLALPDVCARCGQQAGKRLYWDKVVRNHDSEGGDSIVIVGSRAPFCGRCLAQHERELRRMPWWKQLLQCFRWELMIPAAFSGAATLFAAIKLLPNPVKADRLDVAVLAGVVGFFGLISIMSLSGAWTNTRHHCVPPVTTITGSFSFGGDISSTFEGERHRYVIVNDVFFEALLAANRDKLWKPGSERARRASWKRNVLYVGLGLGAAVLLLWDWIKPWVSVEW
ncbi:MAG: hypothetical protein ABI972_14595 [Acidobacteriota bacterium]